MLVLERQMTLIGTRGFCPDGGPQSYGIHHLSDPNSLVEVEVEAGPVPATGGVDVRLALLTPEVGRVALSLGDSLGVRVTTGMTP